MFFVRQIYVQLSAKIYYTLNYRGGMNFMKTFFLFLAVILLNISTFAQTQGEVIVPNTFIRKAPDPNSDKLQTLQQGEKITFENKEVSNGWIYVSASDGKIKGWVNANTVRKATSRTTPTPKPTPTVSSTPGITPAASPNPEVPVEDKEVIQIDTEEVTLNVRVVDDNNRTVNSLNRKEFQVYEDGQLQEITSFLTTQVPTVNALVIDNSRSLRSQLGQVVEAAKILINANQQKDESAIVRFVSANKIEVVQDFTTNKNSLNNALNNLFVEGGQTAIIDATYQTTKKVEQYQASQKIEDVKVRALILVSDGDDRSSSRTEKELLELLRESHVQIYAIGFTDNLSKEPEPDGNSRQEKAKAFLTRLSEETGGKVYFPTSLAELPKIATDISNELRTQYVLTYSPTNDTRDGGFRQIKVMVRDGTQKQKKAITRTGRTAAGTTKP
jgi:Ca-activated chloride channel family protein